MANMDENQVEAWKQKGLGKGAKKDAAGPYGGKGASSDDKDKVKK